TLTAVAAAVNALGNGWSAAVAQAPGGSPAPHDLRALPRAPQAQDGAAELKIHLFEFSAYEVDAERGILFVGAGARDFASGGNRGGARVNYWRVLYTAGFSTVPEDVQEACAQWVAALFWQTKRDPGLAQEQVPSVVSRSPFSDMPPGVKGLLLPYRTYSLGAA